MHPPFASTTTRRSSTLATTSPRPGRNPPTGTDDCACSVRPRASFPWPTPSRIPRFPTNRACRSAWHVPRRDGSAPSRHPTRTAIAPPRASRPPSVRWRSNGPSQRDTLPSGGFLSVTNVEALVRSSDGAWATPVATPSARFRTKTQRHSLGAIRKGGTEGGARRLPCGDQGTRGRNDHGFRLTCGPDGGRTHWAYDEFMARPEGLEPPTPRFEAWYSIQLSYGRMDGRRGVRCRSVLPKCTRGCEALTLAGEGPPISPGFLSRSSRNIPSTKPTRAITTEAVRGGVQRVRGPRLFSVRSSTTLVLSREWPSDTIRYRRLPIESARSSA